MIKLSKLIIDLDTFPGVYGGQFDVFRCPDDEEKVWPNNLFWLFGKGWFVSTPLYMTWKILDS